MRNKNFIEGRALVIATLFMYSLIISLLYVWSTAQHQKTLVSLVERVQPCDKQPPKLSPPQTEVRIQELEDQKRNTLEEIKSIREGNNE